VFEMYSEPAPKLPFLDYALLAVLFSGFWVMVHTCSHYIFASYNQTYIKKN
jgi:hypothetical protein